MDNQFFAIHRISDHEDRDSTLHQPVNSFPPSLTPLGGPLTASEIDHYVAAMSAGQPADPEGTAEALRGADVLRRFLEADTGGDFVMINAIELREPPLLDGRRLDGVEPGDRAQDVLGKYMEYMWPALLRRASHPVLGGSAAAPALDLWGFADEDGAREWSQGAAMRYRSRRDMMEIATNPEFRGRHDFKLAAMAKTIAFPIDPWFSFGDLRLLGFFLLLIALLTHAHLRPLPDPSP